VQRKARIDATEKSDADLLKRFNEVTSLRSAAQAAREIGISETAVMRMRSGQTRKLHRRTREMIMRYLTERSNQMKNATGFPIA
jgi:hypothetical protein